MFDVLFMFFIISTFSEMHKSHVLFPGWYVEQCFTILHFICGSTMFPCSSWFSLFVQMNFDRVVELVLASSLKECICACMRVFTSLQVRPMYSAFWISARYMTALVLQPPSGRGQFFRQLQVGTGVGVCSFWSTFLLWLLIINFIEGQIFCFKARKLKIYSFDVNNYRLKLIKRFWIVFL